jgi:hypothetical protein
VLLYAAVAKKKRVIPKRTKPKRTKQYRGAHRPEDDDYSRGGGMLTKMVRGMQRVAGTNSEKPKGSLLGSLFWWVVLIGAAAFAAYQFL